MHCFLVAGELFEHWVPKPHRRYQVRKSVYLLRCDKEYSSSWEWIGRWTQDQKKGLGPIPTAGHV